VRKRSLESEGRPKRLGSLVVHSSEEEWLGEILEQLDQIVRATDGEFRLALAGGSTPYPLYSKMAARARANAEWHEWMTTLKVFFVDERQVSLAAPESNAGRLERLWEGLPATLFPILEAADYQRLLLDVRGKNPDEPLFHLIILGMGTDGHVASLFPGVTNPDGDLVFETKAPGSGPDRWSLSFQLLQDAASRWLVCRGPDKLEILWKGLAGRGTLPVEELLQGESIPLSCFFLLD
jgi:6-phosphogluconolactonase